MRNAAAVAAKKERCSRLEAELEAKQRALADNRHDMIYGLRLFVLHDFDITGFSILKTLTESGRRYTFRHKIAPIDLGLRLPDVERLGLESEGVAIDKDRDALARRLQCFLMNRG